jgi:hypothetical protein
MRADHDQRESTRATRKTGEAGMATIEICSIQD